jgi:hypothetical protein
MAGWVFAGLELKSWSDAGSMVTACVAIVALGLAVWQAREASKLRRLEAWSRLLDVLGAPDRRAERREAHALIDAGKQFDQMTKAEQQLIESVIVSFDQFAAVIALGALSKRHLKRIAGPVIVANHDRLAQYFANVRALGNSPDKGKPFAELYEMVRPDPSS